MLGRWRSWDPSCHWSMSYRRLKTGHSVTRLQRMPPIVDLHVSPILIASAGMLKSIGKVRLQASFDLGLFRLLGALLVISCLPSHTSVLKTKANSLLYGVGRLWIHRSSCRLNVKEHIMNICQHPNFAPPPISPS